MFVRNSFSCASTQVFSTASVIVRVRSHSHARGCVALLYVLIEDHVACVVGRYWTRTEVYQGAGVLVSPSLLISGAGVGPRMYLRTDELCAQWYVTRRDSCLLVT